jgi:chromosome segregation ATPase
MSDEERDDRNGHDLPREGELLRWAEKTQRTIDFMLQQQAQYQARAEADMQRLRESQDRTDAVVQRFANATLRRFEGVEGEVSNLDRKMEALVDAQIRSEDEMKELREAQKNTDERLNAFIATVERLISERGNGGGKGGVLDE